MYSHLEMLRTVSDLEEAGYTKEQAIQFIQALSLYKLSKCVEEDAGKEYIRIRGTVVCCDY